VKSDTSLYLRKADRDVFLASLDHQQDPLCEALRCEKGSKNSVPNNGGTQMTGKSICNRGVCMEERRGHGKKFIALATCGGSRGQHLSSHRGKFSASNWMVLDIEVEARPGWLWVAEQALRRLHLRAPSVTLFPNRKTSQAASHFRR